jgi:hypothetical protein
VLPYLISRLISFENNYITWLTSSAAGSDKLFAAISQSITKGKTESVISKALRFTLGKEKKKDD